ncbi:hypothetical protein LZ31DRAFT_276148 [Colletotrichum somersetense]|nr:hypothetical protein LZ31DRAFT_276148 [Colletotrichum somersetense]
MSWNTEMCFIEYCYIQLKGKWLDSSGRPPASNSKSALRCSCRRPMSRAIRMHVLLARFRTRPTNLPSIRQRPDQQPLTSSLICCSHPLDGCLPYLLIHIQQKASACITPFAIRRWSAHQPTPNYLPSGRSLYTSTVSLTRSINQQRKRYSEKVSLKEEQKNWALTRDRTWDLSQIESS